MRRTVEPAIRVVAACFVVAVAIVATAAPTMRLPERSQEVAAANHRSWGSVSIVDGLPSDAVNAICQGQDGAIWFATDRGLAVQDGRGTRLVSLGDGEPRRVTGLAAMTDGTMLVASDRGLQSVAGATLKASSELLEANISAVSSDPTGGGIVAASADGRFWSGSLSGEAFVPLVSPQLPSRTDGEPATSPPDISAILWWDGAFFAASRRHGLLVTKKDSVVPAYRGVSANVTALAVDGDGGSLWIGVTSGPRQGTVYQSFLDWRLETVSTEPGAVTGLYAGDSGTCWVSTASSGALRVSQTGINRQATFASTIGGLRSDALRCVFTDREGVVWFGSDRGASRFDCRGSETRPVGQDANGNVVRSISRADNELWVGTNRGAIAHNDAGALVPVATLNGRTVFDVAKSPDFRTLAATQQGVFIAPASKRTPDAFELLDSSPTSDNIRARAIAVSRGTTFIGTFGSGLLALDGDALRAVDFVGAGDAIRDIVCLHPETAETMWIGTAGHGAFRLDRAGLVPVVSEALAGQTVYDIAGSEAATMWFATSAGLVVRDGAIEGRLLSDCDVRAVAPTGARSALCATSNRGAILVAWDDRFGWLESRIDEERGLPSDVTFAVDVEPDLDGTSMKFLIGTSRGLTEYRTSPAPPSIGALGALANRQITAAEVEAGIVLAHPQRSLVLELFATSTRTFRGQFQYGFTVTMADGKEVTHGVVRDGKISIDGLEPGEYRIDAVAFNNDLVASDVHSIRVTVERAPFPWAMTGLAALLLLAVLALAWGAIQNRTIARKNEALHAANLELADTRLLVAQETERERSRIARDLHDQTLADLRRLMLLADKLPAPISDVSPRPGELRQRIEEVSGEIRRICEDLSPSALSNLGLGPALEWLVIQAQSEMPTEQRFTASVTFSDRLEERIDPGSDLPIQIYRIVQEAISNVCRHAKATHVEIDARVDEAGDLTIRIRDDGVGFDDSAEPSGSGRGLGNMRWRADMIHASIGWSRLPGGGTEVTLLRPDENRSAGISDQEA